MKLPGLFLFCLAVFAAGLRAQTTAGDDPKGGTLVACGAEKVVVFARTESPDGRYALGWTIRPKPGQPPVDWSSYDRNLPGGFLEKYPVIDDDPAAVTYTLLDGILDLRAGTFTPLATENPYWPHKNHAGFGAAWSGDDHGTRYAVANNDSRFGTDNLWLVTIRADDIHATDLAPAAIKAVARSLRAYTHQSNRYETAFATSRSRHEGKSVPNPFKGKTLQLRFDAGIPKSIDDRGYEGEVMVSLPGGTITRVRSRVSS